MSWWPSEIVLACRSIPSARSDRVEACSAHCRERGNPAGASAETALCCGGRAPTGCALPDWLKLAMRPRRLAVDAEILRSRARGRRQKAFRGEAAPKQLADCRRPAGHAFGKAEIVDQDQLLLRQHDLQSLVACSLGHDASPLRAYVSINSQSLSLRQ